MRALAVALMGTLFSASTSIIAQGTAVDVQSSTRSTGDAMHHSESKLTSPEFAKKAAAAGMAEVEMGMLGAMKATDAEVKTFAQRVVTDHSKANTELASGAKAKGLEIPSSPDLMHKALMEKFERQTADKDFDRDFMKQMVKDHEAVVELFQNAASDTHLDSDLRLFAKMCLPTLRQHLKNAQTLVSKLDK